MKVLSVLALVLVGAVSFNLGKSSVRSEYTDVFCVDGGENGTLELTPLTALGVRRLSDGATQLVPGSRTEVLKDFKEVSCPKNAQ